MIKLKIIRKFAFSIVVVIGIAIVFFVADIVVKIVLDRDRFWRLEWVF